MKNIELHLTGMAYGGNAIGKHEGKTIFVHYGIPGERVSVHIQQDKGRFAVAELVEVIEVSQSRVQPKCGHFGHCGGCHWQHISYSRQLELKQEIVRDQMARIGGFQDVIVHPTIASPDPWAYRSHSTFHITNDGRLGFIGIDGHTIVAIDECPISRPELVNIARQKRISIVVNKRMRVQMGSEGAPILFPLNNHELQPEGDQIQAVYYTLKGRHFRCSSGSFFQVNLPQAAALVDLVLERLNLRGDEHVLDLYSGVGLFTAFLAENAASVAAIEISPTAIRDAEANLAEFENVTLYEGKTERVLGLLERNYSLAILDPPRAGMELPALNALVGHAPSRIIYVSCDPATLARDAKRLGEKGYKLLDIQPVDMFPQTYHIECVATFSRK